MTGVPEGLDGAAEEDDQLEGVPLRAHEEVARLPREHDAVVRRVDALVAEVGRCLAKAFPRFHQVVRESRVSAASVVVQQSCASPSSTHCLQ